MSRQPPKDPILAFAYQLAFEAGQREFLREHPELRELFRDDEQNAQRRKKLKSAISRRRDERRDRGRH
jgi:hypothetical protein